MLKNPGVGLLPSAVCRVGLLRVSGTGRVQQSSVPPSRSHSHDSCFAGFWVGLPPPRAALTRSRSHIQGRGLAAELHPQPAQESQSISLALVGSWTAPDSVSGQMDRAPWPSLGPRIWSMGTDLAVLLRGLWTVLSERSRAGVGGPKTSIRILSPYTSLEGLV